jgi:hypothetical protein
VRPLDSTRRLSSVKSWSLAVFVCVCVCMYMYLYTCKCAAVGKYKVFE